MKRKRTEKNLFILVSVFLVGTLLAGPLYAQIEEIQLRVDGLACPFCAWGLEKKVMKIEGTTSYDVDMKKGIVHIGLKEDARIQLKQFREAVKEAGFTLRKINLRAKGAIEEGEVGYALVVGGSHERLLLFESKEMAKEYHQGQSPKDLALSEELTMKLAEYVREAKEVRIVGPVHEHDGFPAGLAIEKLEVL